jgi:hypothetical protein
MANKSSTFPLTVPSLRGGLNDNDPSISLPDDACTIAENVEFFFSTNGERRLGCIPVSDTPTQITADSNIQVVQWMGAHYPTNDVGDAELWTLATHLTASNYTINRRTKTAWSNVTAPTDAITVTSGLGHRLSAVSLHGKFYIAYKSGVDLMHVWDGTSIRQAGLAAPTAAPTAADSGVGTFSGTRFYRVREALLSGSTVELRSEPSPVKTFTPSGSGASVIVTKPATQNASATHWEIEASEDNANFYRVSRIAIGTTTYTDSQPFNSGYAIIGVLSEDLTSYTQIPSGKFVTVDSDRLIIAGSWENPIYGSRIWWTPQLANTGNGNDERLDMTVFPFIDLDGFEGGEITGISRAVNGYLYAFKWGAIYKIVRTGQRTSAYTAIPLTKSRGALPGSLIEAVDQSGNPAQYFLDPKVGPMRIGVYGVEWCGRDIRKLWTRLNHNATVPCHGAFYPGKNQIHWWLALDGADHPNAKIIVQVNEMRSTMNDGARRGWSTVPVGNRIADAHCSLSFANNLTTTDPREQDFTPFIGKEQWTVGAITVKNLLQQCDQGSTDALFGGDTLAYYYAKIQSKPFTPVGLLSKFGIMSGTLVATTSDPSHNDVYIQIIGDFGKNISVIKSIGTTPTASETITIKRLDDLSTSDLITIQFLFGDLDTDVLPATAWRLHSFSAKLRAEQSQ